MPAFAALLTLATAALSVTAAPVKRDSAPKSWATGYLEDYETYHTRYLALDCQSQHNTTFFASCCHPLLATETINEHRPAECTPNATASSSAAAAAATSNSTDSQSEYCSDASEVASYVSSAVSAGQTQSVVYTAASTTATLAVQQNIATSEAAPSTTSTYQAPAATTTAASSGGNGQTYSGDATYYYQNGNAGACGTVHSDSDKIIAINSNGFWADYATNSNNGNCGKWVTITNSNNGKTVSAMVADVCPTCSGDASIDLSVGAFTAIASESQGMVPITWSFN